MNIDRIPKFYMNLTRRQDRRFAVEEEFAKHGLEVERIPAVNARYVRDARGYDSMVSYAIALTKRLAIRRARLQGAEAVIIFEDDVQLHPEFRRRLEVLDVPDDWGIFHFGCRHAEVPDPETPGIVRCRKTWDNHAFAIRAELFHEASRAMRGSGRGTEIQDSVTSDRRLSDLSERVPVYAAYPNLAWQRYSHSDHVAGAYTSYSREGRQVNFLHVIVELETKLREKANAKEPAGLIRTEGNEPGIRSIETDVSVAVVTCHAGKESGGVFARWRRWLQGAALPKRSALYVVNGSGNEDFADRLGETLRGLAQGDRIRVVMSVQGPPASGAVRNSAERNARVAEVYNTVLPRITEDYILIVEDDTIPQQETLAALLRAFERLESEGKRPGLVSGCYESANNRSHLCAARGRDNWTDIPLLGEIGSGDLIEVGFAGIGCCLIRAAALRETLPWRGDATGGPDFHFCQDLRQRGYTIWLDGDVRAEHLLDPKDDDPTGRVNKYVREIEKAGSDSLEVFGGTYRGGHLAQQVPGEFARLLALLAPLGPFKKYGEIGTASGGATRLLFEKVGFERGVLIDDGRHPEAGLQTTNLRFLPVTQHVGNSHSQEAADFLRGEMGGEKFDVVFIDGDHSEAGVRADIEMVHPHCHDRTILFFHDIAVMRPPEFGVHDVWGEAKLITPVAEYVEELGIGVAVLPSATGNIVRRNLVYYIYPSERSNVWKENVAQIRERWLVFTGRKIVTVAQGEGLAEADEVRRLLPEDASVQVVENDPELWEVPHFYSALREVASLSPFETTFYAHAKGASRRHGEERARQERLWRNRMYTRCLNVPDEIDAVLSRTPCCGCFRRRGDFTEMPETNWHFSGTFFWFNHAQLFTKFGWDMPEPSHGRHGVEGYLGRFFEADEGTCLFGENAPNLYHAPPSYFAH